MSDAVTALAPDALFVVACPVCQGQVAATGSLCGRDACCPLCATLFHVPFPAPVTTPAEAEPTPAVGMAEDWGGVITQLAPTRRDAEPTPEPAAAPADFELQREPEPPPSAPPVAATPVAGSPVAASPVAASPAALAPSEVEVRGEAEVESLAEASFAGVVEVDEAAVEAPPPQEPAPQPVTAAEQLPVAGGPPLQPRAAELVFSEPVRTIRHGNTVIELRRLSPEERRARRIRRNILMIVIGVSILLAVYVLLS